MSLFNSIRSHMCFVIGAILDVILKLSYVCTELSSFTRKLTRQENVNSLKFKLSTSFITFTEHGKVVLPMSVKDVRMDILAVLRIHYSTCRMQNTYVYVPITTPYVIHSR